MFPIEILDAGPSSPALSMRYSISLQRSERLGWPALPLSTRI
jgi:hypothetical protein